MNFISYSQVCGEKKKEKLSHIQMEIHASCPLQI